MNERAESQAAKSLVVGGTGIVGGYIVDHLLLAGERPLALSRSPRNKPDVVWFQGDLTNPETLQIPPFATLYCTADAVLLPAALPHLFNPSLKRIVIFSSTSVLTKIDSEIVAEREMWQNLADAEEKIVAACKQRDIEWTILRPTLIYAEGRDQNITPLSRLIRRFGVMPAGRRGIGFAATGACGGSGDRRHRRGIEPIGGQQILFTARRRNAYLSGNGRPHLRRLAAAAANHSSPGLSVASGVCVCKAAVPRRKCRDGNPNDGGHDFRLHAGQTRLRLEPEDVRSDVRLSKLQRFGRTGAALGH